MKQFRCDICNTDTGEHELTTLYKEYKFDNIEHICSDCNDKINNVILKINSIFSEIKTSWIRKIIQKMFNKAKEVLNR